MSRGAREPFLGFLLCPSGTFGYTVPKEGAADVHDRSIVQWAPSMLVIAVLAGVLGALIVVGTLVELFETIVLPRRVTRRFRMTRAIYHAVWLPGGGLARLLPRRREGILSVLGPLSLIVLIVSWAVGLIVGFALLHWALGTELSAGSRMRLGFLDDIYFSATTFLTLGLGDIIPRAGAAGARLLVMLEAGGGFAVLALVIGYLPALYQAFARRETAVSLLDARAGSPPSAGELVRRYTQEGTCEELSAYLQDWEAWAADLMESHLSYPMLSYFRSQHDNQSWLAALTTVLDTCALLIAAFPAKRQRPVKLTYAMCRHFAVDLAQVLRAPPEPPPYERLSAPDLMRLHAMLRESGLTPADEEALARKLGGIRDSYEPYVAALSRRLAMPLPPWLPAEEAADDWKATAWDPSGRVLL